MRLSLIEILVLILLLLLIVSFLVDVWRKGFRFTFDSAMRSLDQFSPLFFFLVASIELLAVLVFSIGRHFSLDIHAVPSRDLSFAFGDGMAGFFLWNFRQKSKREPTAPGQIVALGLIAWGIVHFIVNLANATFSLSPIISFGIGALLLVVANRQFRKQRGEHRILQHVAAQGDVLQPEYHRPTPECPEPERWRMYDSMTAEYEVLAFLQQLVETLKPKIIVETGTFMGISTLKLAEGLKANGIGKVITCEYDPVVYAKAVGRIQDSGLKEWIDVRNESSLEMKIDGEVDLLFSDSDPDLREAEVRRFLPLLRRNGIILIHDASSHLKTVREAALKLEREGLISAVLLPTPRGLVIAQKREHRTE